MQDISRSCGPIFIPSHIQVDIDSLLHASTVGWSTLTFDLLFKVIYCQNTVFWSCRLGISRSVGPIFIPSCMLVDIDSLSLASIFGWSTVTFDLLTRLFVIKILFFRSCRLDVSRSICPILIPLACKSILRASCMHQLFPAPP